MNSREDVVYSLRPSSTSASLLCLPSGPTAINFRQNLDFLHGKAHHPRNASDISNLFPLNPDWIVEKILVIHIERRTIRISSVARGYKV